MKKDVLRLRDEKVHRLTVEFKVRQCILNGLSELANSAKEIVVGTEMDIRPEWWSCIRSRPNNLGL